MLIKLNKMPSFYSYSAIGGSYEAEGPLGDLLDYVDKSNRFGQRTWEKSEAKMQDIALKYAMDKRGLSDSDVDLLFAGDLINQCTSSGMGLVDYQIPFAGIYGACSTAALGLCLGAIALQCDGINRAAAVTSSHFCSAERQFRYPLEYGSLRTPTSQHTVTGACAFILEENRSDALITHVIFGQSIDSGITDANNMGAAMAPAAADTIERFFKSSSFSPDDIGVILSGDLGYEGYTIVLELMKQKGIPLSTNYDDCGLRIYYRDSQQIQSGASGCACSAIVLATQILPKIESGELKSALFVGTGALLSKSSVLQGQSIAAIAHGLLIENRKHYEGRIKK